jgi:hypothetical protein
MIRAAIVRSSLAGRHSLTVTALTWCCQSLSCLLQPLNLNYFSARLRQLGYFTACSGPQSAKQC